MMNRLICDLSISSISLLLLSAMADHPPKRFLRDLLAFNALGKTGKLDQRLVLIHTLQLQI